MAANGFYVYAFEANPLVFDIMNISVKINKFDNIKSFNFGVSDKVGKAKIDNFNENNIGGQSLKIGEGEIELKPLDDIEFHKKISVIKIDVEGMEINVLKGAKNTINNYRPMLYIEAININDTRALHAAQLVRDCLRNMGRTVAASEVTVLGASYREDVGDTRYSGSEIIVRKLTEMGATVKAHDPYVQHWWELENQEKYPAAGVSWSRFFRNQEELQGFKMTSDLAEALKGADAIVLAVRHRPYLDLSPDEVVRMAGGPLAVIDCFGILNDARIERFFELDCEVKGLGRGHINRIKDKVRKEKIRPLSSAT